MNNNSSQQPSMKWHKFLIYFSLWFSAVVAALNAFSLLTGSRYGSQDVMDAFYTHYQGLKSVDTVFGILLFALAGYLIYTRFQLAGFKPGAPNKLTVTYVLSAAVNIGYLLVTSSVTKLPLSEIGGSSISGSIAISVAMIIVNYNYYKKRDILFNARPESGTATAQTFAVPPTYTATPTSTDNRTSAHAPEQVRFCTHCGLKAEPGDKWCTRCGTKLD